MRLPKSLTLLKDDYRAIQREDFKSGATTPGSFDRRGRFGYEWVGEALDSDGASG